MPADLVPSLPVAEAFDQEYLEYYRMLPLELSEGVLRVAVAGDPNPEALDDLATSFNAKIDTLTVDETELADAIRRTFAAAESVVELVKDLGQAGSHGPAEEHAPEDVRSLANQPFVIRFVNLLIRDAYEASASDIHLEAGANGLRVRLRIDGVLSDLPAPPRGHQEAVISRIKLLAELDFAERRVPQDGRIRVRLESRELDLRVATTPTLHGESVVLRLLDRGGRPVGLDELGMGPDLLDRFRRLSQRTHGIILATGPTGSGKTTTLYAALRLRHPSEEKVLTVEDPVEYHLPGITQVPVHPKAGVTFGTALRSLLRQDPDVIMVGEMRDAETAGIAVQAAMTGHLVFSTLHTNDAVSALTRLMDLGVEAYMIAATVECVLAQRLVRRVCPECIEGYRPSPQVVAWLSGRPQSADRPLRLKRGRGCDRCRGTGYCGRIGLFELLVVTDELRHLLATNPASAILRSAALEAGMTTLRSDGWTKAESGLTTVEEVLRVVGE